MNTFFCKKTFLTTAITLLFTFGVLAQVPQKISFQAVVRNSSNALITNGNVSLRISLLQGSTTGTTVYSETHNSVTNANGLATLQIGGGTVISGSFAIIDWANGPYFIKTEADPSGGTNYTLSSVTQLLSVPYAMYAQTSGSSTPGPQGPAGPQGIAGANGIDGKNTLVKTTTEAAGANCATGGTKIEVGLDANANGILDAGEVNATLTKYVCDGTTGATGPQGPSGSTGIPSGTIMAYGGTTIPSGWLLCDGSAISRTTYSDLYTAIGNNFGSGDGTTTFNLPDFRGRFLRGVAGTSTNDPDKVTRTASATGGNTGNNIGSLQNDEIKSHSHNLVILPGCSGGNNGNTTSLLTGSSSGMWGLSTGCGVTGNNTASIASNGGNETRPKNVYVNYIIKQ